jgi:acyl carrier protein
VDLNHYVRLCQELAPRKFLAELERLADPEEQKAEPTSVLTGLPPEARQERLTDEVLDAVSGALGLDGTDLDTDAGFFELGMDSVMALTVRRRLEDVLGLELPSTLAFEYPTAAKLAEYLGDLLKPTNGHEPASQGKQEEHEEHEEHEEQETDELLQALEHAMASAERDMGMEDSR